MMYIRGFQKGNDVQEKNTYCNLPSLLEQNEDNVIFEVTTAVHIESIVTIPLFHIRDDRY